MKIFLSAVSDQLKDCRQAVASDLRAIGAEVVEQQDFQQYGRTLLEKLEDYIARCDRVIALVGSAYGWEPPNDAVPGKPRRSYSQWEYFFATGDRLDGANQPAKDLYVYLAGPTFLEKRPVDQLSDIAALQAAFIAGIRSSGKDHSPFGSLNELRAAVLRDVLRLAPSGAAVTGSHTVLVQANGRDAIELSAPAFPRPLPQGPAREVDLLKAAYSVVNFEGRADLFEDFVGWCAHAREVSVRTLVGAGGAGKTRFAYELYRHVRNNQDWDAKFVHFLTDDARAVDIWQHISSPNALLIVDYASDVAKPLGALLRHLQEPFPTGRRLRVLLLARAAEWGQGWLASMRTGRTGGDVERLFHPREPIQVPPLSAPERRRVFAQTLVQLADVAARMPPPLPAEDVFERPETAQRLHDPLTLMMAAATALRSGAEAALSLNRSELAFEVAKELVAGRMADAVRSHHTLFLHMAAYATLCGGLDQDEALQALDEESNATRLGRVEDPQRFLSALQSWLPGDQTWIGTIQPDIVGEAFLLGEKGHPFLVAPDGVILRAVERKQRAVVGTIVRLVQDFGFAAETPRTEPGHWLEGMLEKGKTAEDPGLLAQLSDGIPRSTSSLRDFGLRVAQALYARCIEMAQNGGDVDAALMGTVLDNLASRYSDAGDPGQAVITARQAVKLRRDVIGAGGDAFSGDLARALNNLASEEAAVGRFKEGLTAAQEAESLYRKIAENGNAAAISLWATSLENLANRQSQVGRLEESLVNSERAAQLWRACATGDRDTYLPSLATALINLSNHRAAVWQWTKGLTAAQEATDLFREAVQRRRDEWLPRLASALDALANRQTENGLDEAALQSIDEAIELWRELILVNRPAFLYDLAIGVHNLSLKQSGAKRKTEALASATEAAALWRELVLSNRDAFMSGLAGTLQNLSALLEDAAQARDTMSDAIALWRDVVEANREAYLPDLAGSLNDYALQQARAGLRDAAVNTMEEAVTLWTELVSSSPTHSMAWAKSLTNLTDRYNDAGRFEAARRSGERAIAAYEDLMRIDRAAFVTGYARAQASSGRALVGLKDYADATDMFAESLENMLPWVAQTGKHVDVVERVWADYTSALREAGHEPRPEIVEQVNRVLGS